MEALPTSTEHAPTEASAIRPPSTLAAPLGGTAAPPPRPVAADVIRVVTSEKLLCSIGEKAFRAAIASSLTDDTFIATISGDYDIMGEPYFTDATPAELLFLKAADVVGVRSSSAQLLSVVLMAGITHRNGDASACVDSLLAAAFGAPGRHLSAAEAREQLLVMAMVTPMPDSLPEPATSRGAEGPYVLALEEYPFVNNQIQAFMRWSQNAVQLSRPGIAVADATRDNTVNVARAVLGWAKHINGREDDVDLRWLLDGDLLAAKKKPMSLSTEVSSIVRILEFLGSAVRLDEASAHDLAQLKASMRRLASQLSAMHRPTTSIETLEAAGKWAEMEEVQEKVRAEASAVLAAAESELSRDPRLARRVHDALMAAMVTVDCAPNRPGCLRVLVVPDSDVPCYCGHDGCLGNRFVGSMMKLTHSKTARHRDAIKVDFAGTLTERLLSHHLSWGRLLLLAHNADTDALWITTRGKAFGSDESFAAYLPRTLARLDLPHLSFTTLRHAAVVAASEWASREELEGMASAIGTSVRKMQEVYDYRCAERSSGRFLAAYRARGAEAEAEKEDEEADGATAAPGVMLVAGVDAHAAARAAPPPAAPPPHAARSASFSPILAFGRMLGLGRMPAAPAATAAKPATEAAGAELDLGDDDSGVWHGSFDLPGGTVTHSGGGASKPSSGGPSGSELAITRYVPPQLPSPAGPPMRDAMTHILGSRSDGGRGTGSGGGGGGGSGGAGSRDVVAAAGPRSRVPVATNASTFLDFLAAQKERKHGGPGRTAAAVKRYLTQGEVDVAMQGGIAAKRAAYTWAYGFATSSGNLAWLHSKLEAAVRMADAKEEED